jgi:hypothetical protein
MAARTPEERSEIARKANEAQTPEQRSERARRAQSVRTPEQRREIAMKAVETRRRNARRRETANLIADLQTAPIDLAGQIGYGC